MASDSGDNQQGDQSEGREAALHEPRECMACRGSGEVISNLGGTPSKVSCPWCEGRGVRAPGIDAQARWATAAQGEPAQGPTSEQAD